MLLYDSGLRRREVSESKISNLDFKQGATKVMLVVSEL